MKIKIIRGMMRNFLFILLIIALVSEINAHEFKIFGGNNLSRYTVTPETYQGFDWFEGSEYRNENRYKQGLLVGGGIEFSFSKNIAIEVDILYFQKGSDRLLRRDGVPYIKTDFKLREICLPILLKLRLCRASTPYLLGGFEFAYILSHDSAEVEIDLEEQEPIERNLKDSTESFDFVAVLGAGIEMNIRGVTFFVEGRYHLGILNIMSKYYQFETLKTNSEVLLFGIKI